MDPDRSGREIDWDKVQITAGNREAAEFLGQPWPVPPRWAATGAARKQSIPLRGKIGQVVVVGAGPAGLAAAHAATGLGYPVRVIAPRVKSPQRGPLLLQRPIPGINQGHPDGYIRQIVIGGSILDYRVKLYGDVNISINGDVLQPGYHAWRFPETYDRLWELYSHLIEGRIISGAELREQSFATCGDTLWVSTAPVTSLCTMREVHEFVSAEIYITQTAIFPRQPDDTIIFNGDPSVPWARSSRIFGIEVTEWSNRPDDERLIGHHSRFIRKPVSTTCDCHPHVLRTGRFGAWRNETWVDTAYYDVRNALVSDQRQGSWARVFESVKEK